MKKHLALIILLTTILLPVQAQKSKDALYLKNGSIIYGKLIEIEGNQYKIQTADGSLLIYPDTDVEKYAKESPTFEGRKKEGPGFALEAGFLVGAQSTDYAAPFSFNILASYTIHTKYVFSAGTGVEFLGVPFTPIFAEYRYILKDKKASPYIFLRGGKMLHLGAKEETNDNNYYEKKNFKGGFTCTLGTGVSWAREDIEPYLSFAYRYALTSYVQSVWGTSSYYDATFRNNYNRLEIKFGFKF
jgi:hypothetical protein